jgi:hypothetical protein
MTRPPLLRVIGVLEAIVVRLANRVKSVLLAPEAPVAGASPAAAMEAAEVVNPGRNPPVRRRA